jgi:rhomboid protease GluP
MSNSNGNIHLLGGDESDNESESNNKTPIFLKIVYKGDPREQTLLSYLQEVICPFFRIKSFSFIILIINLIVFIASLIPNGLEPSQKELKFLPPSTITLDKMGSLWGAKIKESFWESYRWIANSVLHGNFEHLFSNSLGILFFGTMVEYLIGTVKFCLIYILSGILGSLFTVLIQQNTSNVGASICCFGIMGAMIAFYIINWKGLGKIFGVNNKCLIVFFPTMMIFLSLFILSIDDTEINIYGHIGGLIFGFFLGLVFIRPKNDMDVGIFNRKILFIIGLIVCIGFPISGFPCFYLLD